jgi:predicted O-methyltransferase YrrM
MKNKVYTNVSKWMDSFVFFLETIKLENPDIPIWVGLESNILEKCIYYNTEQLTRKDSLNQVISISKNNNVLEIWDYSLINIKILKENNIENVKHVPLESPEWYINKLKTFQQENFEYEVGFCGCLTDRRAKILNELKSKGVKINTILSWGVERDIELAKCKTILNIHVEDNTNIFESARCEPWLKLGIPVITEKSLDDDPRCIVSEYKNLVQTTIDYLEKNNLKIKMNQIKMSNPYYEFAKYNEDFNRNYTINNYFNNTNYSEFIKTLCALTNAKSYLELGVSVGFTIFNVSKVVDKVVGVDIQDIRIFKTGEFHMTTTNDFFKNQKDTFDIIFIDANHDYEAVKEDFDNSVKILNEYGIIILDDTDPLHQSLTHTTRCSDCYLMNDYIRTNYSDLDIIVLPILLKGMTLVTKKRNPRFMLNKLV